MTKRQGTQKTVVFIGKYELNLQFFEKGFHVPDTPGYSVIVIRTTGGRETGIGGTYVQTRFRILYQKDITEK